MPREAVEALGASHPAGEAVWYMWRSWTKYVKQRRNQHPQAGGRSRGGAEKAEKLSAVASSEDAVVRRTRSLHVTLPDSPQEKIVVLEPRSGNLLSQSQSRVPATAEASEPSEQHGAPSGGSR